jgi:hypothetical protein
MVVIGCGDVDHCGDHSGFSDSGSDRNMGFALLHAGGIGDSSSFLYFSRAIRARAAVGEIAE